MISNYPAKYNEPMPFSQRVIIAAHLLAWIGPGLRGQHVHVNPGYLTRHGQNHARHGGGVGEWMRADRDSEEALFPDAVALLHQPGRFEIHQWTIRLRDRLLPRTRNPSGRLCVGPVGGTGGNIKRFASKDHPLRNHLHGLDLHQPLGLKRSSKESIFHYAPQERCHPVMPER
jgi:hypothetical protein